MNMIRSGKVSLEMSRMYNDSYIIRKRVSFEGKTKLFFMDYAYPFKLLNQGNIKKSRVTSIMEWVMGVFFLLGFYPIDFEVRTNSGT